jgi:CheY-like chemotaxis protein
MQKALLRSNEEKSKLKPLTLLLVDDNQINLRLLSTYLNRRNYEIVDEAQNGLEAVHRVEARQKGYDIIFIDITMPILNGFGATRQICAIKEKRKKSAMESIGLGGRDLGVDGVRNSSEALSMAQSHTEGT